MGWKMGWKIAVIDIGIAALMIWSFITNNNFETVAGIGTGVLLIQGIMEIGRK